MSRITTIEIEGDAAVGRDVAVGGNVQVSGDAVVKGGLKVNGWLDAKNIKGVNKGVFKTRGKLEECYPDPRDGWFAGVVVSDANLDDLGIVDSAEAVKYIAMYVSEGGRWESTQRIFQIVVEDDEMNSALAALEENAEAMARAAKSDSEVVKFELLEYADHGGAVLHLKQNGYASKYVHLRCVGAEDNGEGPGLLSKAQYDGLVNGIAALEGSIASVDQRVDGVEDAIAEKADILAVSEMRDAVHELDDRQETLESQIMYLKGHPISRGTAPSFINVNAYVGNPDGYTLAGALSDLEQKFGVLRLSSVEDGTVITFKSESTLNGQTTWETWQFCHDDPGCEWTDADQWKKWHTFE